MFESGSVAVAWLGAASRSHFLSADIVYICEQVVHARLVAAQTVCFECCFTHTLIALRTN